MAEQSTLEYIISGTCDTGVLYGNVLLYSESKRLHDGRRPTDWGKAVPLKAICTMASFCYRYQNASVSCFLVHIRAFVVLNLAGIAKFKYEKKNKMDSGSSEMTASCKWPIILFLFLFEEKVYSVFDRCVFIRINFESNVLYLFFCRILNGDNTEWHKCNNISIHVLGFQLHLHCCRFVYISQPVSRAPFVFFLMIKD